MKPLFTTRQIRSLEQDFARIHNGHCFELMQKAGRAVYNYLVKEFKNPSPVWVFCGRGNNGGDGYIVALLLQEAKVRHTVFALGEPHEGTEAHTAYRRYLGAGGAVRTDLPPADEPRPAVIVDALLGTGVHAAPEGRADDFIRFINVCQAPKISIDVPSGAAADTGAVPGNCINAYATVCMLGLKGGLFTSDAVDYTGRVLLDTLGVDTDGFEDSADGEKSLPAHLYSYADCLEDLPRRTAACHKGDNGRVLIIGGAQGYGGAAIIAGQGALRAGAGLVKVALDRSNIPAMNAVRPELMSVNIDDETALEKAVGWAEVLAVGPGLGLDDRARRIVEMAEQSGKPLVLDADALTLLSRDPHVNERRIITPHPGEAGRLLGYNAVQVNADRFAAVRSLQQRYGGVVLLKGAGSLVCNGRRLALIHEGSAAMATGGMGDLLTGLIAALLGQGLTAFQATLAAACVHGRAGYLAGQHGGVVGTLPADLLPYVRKLINGAA